MNPFHQDQIPHISNHDVLFAYFNFCFPEFSPAYTRTRSYENFNINNVFNDLDVVD